jgi:hypothetical protein
MSTEINCSTFWTVFGTTLETIEIRINVRVRYIYRAKILAPADWHCKLVLIKLCVEQGISVRKRDADGVKKRIIFDSMLVKKILFSIV